MASISWREAAFDDKGPGPLWKNSAGILIQFFIFYVKIEKICMFPCEGG